jgi:uncharacterized protein YijF (DUF1287 family)
LAFSKFQEEKKTDKEQKEKGEKNIKKRPVCDLSTFFPRQNSDVPY